MTGKDAPLARAALAKVFGVPEDALALPTPLSLGMTNRSYLGRAGDTDCIIRIPGEGTDHLISRRQEHAVYQAVQEYGLCDDVLSFDPDTGIKITRYIHGARSCDPNSPGDLAICMARLRSLHEMNLQVGHTFDPFEKLEEYESFWEGRPSAYPDYAETKARVLALRPWLKPEGFQKRLCHVDPVSDNFLLFQQEGETQVRLIDWEYSGMGDPLMDLAFFGIYVSYDKAQVDRLIGIYDPGLDEEAHRRVYGWAAVCGLLWSNWCEYKFQLGVDFGDYAKEQYRQARDFQALATRGGTQ